MIFIRSYLLQGQNKSVNCYETVLMAVLSLV